MTVLRLISFRFSSNMGHIITPVSSGISPAHFDDFVKNVCIFWVQSLIIYYSIHVPGWLQKWLNLITAPGSVSNEPGSVTWLATKYLKTVSWRNHTEKLTTWWPQNISFWPKINIPSSYFTILMLNCLENTPKLLFDSYVTAVKFLTKSISKQPQPDLTFQHCWNQSRF